VLKDEATSDIDSETIRKIGEILGEDMILLSYRNRKGLC
jgi:hypothetical protein